MISNSMKMLVAQNCDNYNPKYILSLLSMSSLSESCSNCQNYVNGKCTKESFDEIMETINRN